MTEGTLEARLERLERENRRLRLGMLAVVAAVALRVVGRRGGLDRRA